MSFYFTGLCLWEEPADRFVGGAYGGVYCLRLWEEPDRQQGTNDPPPVAFKNGANQILLLPVGHL